MNDFAAIAAAALSNADSLVAEWLPDGRRRGNEWVARNPTRADGKPGSFSVNLTSGKWADFATGDRGGDLVSLRAYLDGSNQGDALKAVSADLGLTGGRRNGRKPFRGQALAPAPETQPEQQRTTPGTPPETFTHPTLAEPSAKWAYRNAAGDVVGFACRFDLPTGKQVLPFAWTGESWEWRAMPEPRPLFNLPEILSKPEAVVLVVEGEKTATAAAYILPDVVATTWAGGCKAWKKTNWTPLQGRKVILWPDADEPGRATMAAVAGHLLEIGAAAVKLVEIAETFPPGWDAADAVSEGWTRAEVLALLAGRAAPEGLCVLCWRERIAAPIGGPTCRHSNFQWPKWTPEQIEMEGMTP